MPSGKKSKQARRAAAAAPPPVVSKGGRRRRQADPKILAIAVAVLVLAGVGIGLGVALSGGDSSASGTTPTIGNAATGLPGAPDINAELEGIPQKGLTLGSAKAPVTLTEYVDLQCPVCRAFETTVMPDIIDTYVRPGKLRIETRVLKFIGPDSLKAREAMLAAAKQNKAYEFALVLYANQGTENTGWVTDDMLRQIAASVNGLNVPTLMNDRGDSSVTKLGDTFDRQATADKVPGTPTVYVGKTGTKGDVVDYGQDVTNSRPFFDAIDAALP